jgi:hypothetical protein
MLAARCLEINGPTLAISSRLVSAFGLAKGLQYDPDEGQRRHAKRDRGDVIVRLVEFHGFIAKVVGRGAAHGGDQVLPQVVSGNTLGALQKQNDQPRKDDDGNPIVRCFHCAFPKIWGRSTAFSRHVASVMDFGCRFNHFMVEMAGLSQPLGVNAAYRFAT